MQEVFTPRTRTFFDLTFRTVNNRSVARKPERREKANERNLEDRVNRKKLVSLGVFVVTLATAASVLAQRPPVHATVAPRPPPKLPAACAAVLAAPPG